MKAKRDSLVQRILPKLPPNPTLLKPSKRHIRMQAVHTVDPRSPRLQPMRCIDRPVQILRENSSSQAVDRIVRLLDHFVFVLEFDHDADGTEDLFLDDLHAGGDVGEDGGFYEETFGSLSFAADCDRGTCVFAGLDVGHYALRFVIRAVR